jgi:hypothetical protein
MKIRTSGATEGWSQIEKTGMLIHLLRNLPDELL